MVVGVGFEPTYAMRADLQSAAFNHSATPPGASCALNSGAQKRIFLRLCQQLYLLFSYSYAHICAMKHRKPQKPYHKPKKMEPKKKGFRANFFGWHACTEVWLNPKRQINSVFLTESNKATFEELYHKAKKAGLKRPEPQIIEKDVFEQSFPKGTTHQGIAIQAGPLPEYSVQDLIGLCHGDTKHDVATKTILVLDQVTDPHNVGAILRSACALGAVGVVMQSKHAPELNGTLAKIACGATEHIPVAFETNLSRALETLQEAHFHVVGLDEHSDQHFRDLPPMERAVLILGAEGSGMRRLIKEKCDFNVTLPTFLPIASLNVSNAAAISLYAILNRK